MYVSDEIGSEFWEFGFSGKKMPITYLGDEFDIRYLLSGRTALDLIIKDIYEIKGKFKIYLPSYCCHTMIEPFVKNGIEYKFYPVSFSQRLNFGFEKDNDCDVIYLLDYFGVCCKEVEDFAKEQRMLGKLVIYDATQSVFSNPSVLKYSDYIFYSLRKWDFINCAVALKRGNFAIECYDLLNEKYLEIRNSAARKKRNYIHSGNGDKGEFLNEYSSAEELLEKDYCGYTAHRSEIEKVDFIDGDFLINARKSNALILQQGLGGLSDFIKPMFSDISLADTPLFYPIIVDEQHRDNLRKHLIQNKIYCPVHWPLSELHPNGDMRSIYMKEISVICDQRYNADSMKKIIWVIKEYVERNG